MVGGLVQVPQASDWTEGVRKMWRLSEKRPRCSSADLDREACDSCSIATKGSTGGAVDRGTFFFFNRNYK